MVPVFFCFRGGLRLYAAREASQGIRRARSSQPAEAGGGRRASARVREFPRLAGLWGAERTEL